MCQKRHLAYHELPITDMYVYVCMRACMYVRGYAYARTYTCMYVHMYTRPVYLSGERITVQAKDVHKTCMCVQITQYTCSMQATSYMCCFLCHGDIFYVKGDLPYV